MDDFHDLVTSLAGVRRAPATGPARWQCRGRLVARELNPAQGVADLAAADNGAVEDAVASAWRLQADRETTARGPTAGA